MHAGENYNEPTTIAAYTEAIIRALEASGVDPLEVLRDADVDRVRSNDPMLRITDSSVNAIFARAIAVTGDEYFGLRVANQIVPGMLHALGYALLASETLEDFCTRLARYFAVVSQSAALSVEKSDAELLLYADLRNSGLCLETQDVFLAVIVRLMREALSPGFDPLRVELLRPEPAGGAAPFAELLRCPIEFSRPRLCLHLDLAQVRQPLLGASPEMAQHNDRIVMGYLERLEKDDIVNRVRSHVINGLSAGGFGREEIAARMHMSASTLQAKLARRGVSFQQVLDSTRHELARGYISQSRLSITEIAFMLGFSDVSNFNRAFRRWTGKAPTEFRESG